MFMEDILSAMLSANVISVRAFNYNILHSFHEQNLLKQGLTEKQRNLLEKIFKQNASKLSNCLKHDVTQFVENPIYRLPMRVLSTGKIVSIVDCSKFGKKLKISFPYDKNIIADLQTNKNLALMCNWEPDTRAWTMPLVEKNIVFTKDFVSRHEFTVSDEVKRYFLGVDTIISDMENYVPIVVEQENNFFLKNFPGDHNLHGETLIEKLFSARKKGVMHWDQKVDEKLANFPISDNLKAFIKLEPSEIYRKSLTEIELDDIAYIVKQLSPCLIIIPSNDTLEIVKNSLKIIEKIGFLPEELSVMFRLPNATDKDFNQFVKEQKLNNPISEKTKVVFVSGKMTKPILESRIYFHSVISYNSVFPHYAMSNFLKNQANVIELV